MSSSAKTPRTSMAFEVLFVSIICSAQLMTQAGLALSVVPMFIIGNSYGSSDPGQLSWFTAAYSLTVGTFILIAGRLGDTFGHKRFFVAGFLWYGLWCMIGGLAIYSNQILFDISRAMQGIGPAFLLPNAIAIIGHTYAGQNRKQEMIFSLFGATAPGGFVLGAVFSSLLSERLSWPWAYWIMAITCCTLGIISVFVIPRADADEEEEEDSRISPLWQRLDIPGSVVGVCGLVLFNFAWNQGASIGWEAPYIGVTLALGVIVLCIFTLIEIKATHPLVPFRLLTTEALLSLICISAGWASFGNFVLYLWTMMDNLRNQSILLTSAQFSVVAVSGLCAAITTGFVISHLRISLVMLMAMTAFTVGGILFATMPVDQTYWAQTFVGLIILPWGMDMSFPAGTIVVSRAMPKKQQGVGASLVNTVVNYSISIGLGIAGTVQVYLVRGGADPLQGIRSSWYTAIGLAGVGFCTAIVWCLTEKRPKKSKDVTEGSV